MTLEPRWRKLDYLSFNRLLNTLFSLYAEVTSSTKIRKMSGYQSPWNLKKPKFGHPKIPENTKLAIFWKYISSNFKALGVAKLKTNVISIYTSIQSKKIVFIKYLFNISLFSWYQNIFSPNQKEFVFNKIFSIHNFFSRFQNLEFVFNKI